MKGRLLVVDDDESIRRLLAREFRDRDYECEEADGVPQAIDKLLADEFDVLITDKNMPCSSGRSEGGMVLLQWARQNRPDLATIVMTGYATPDSAIEALREGAVDYLMKPLDRGTLHRRVDRVVEFRRFVNAPGVLGLYMDVLREVIETAADELTSETEQRLNQVRERLDQLFRTMRMMEQTLIEQRRQLAEIASCAEEGHDCCPPNETARPILAHIAALAARRL